MSAVALAAFYRLRVLPKLRGACCAVLLYLALKHNEVTNDAWPSLRAMVDDLDLSEKTVLRSLKELDELGLIVRGDNVGGRGKKTRYTLAFLAADASGKHPRGGWSLAPEKHPPRQSETPPAAARKLPPSSLVSDRRGSKSSRQNIENMKTTRGRARDVEGRALPRGNDASVGAWQRAYGLFVDPTCSSATIAETCALPVGQVIAARKRYDARQVAAGPLGSCARPEPGADVTAETAANGTETAP